MYEYADYLPDSKPQGVPDFAANTRPWLNRKVWKAPPGQEHRIGEIEMLSGWEDDGDRRSYPISFGYLRITAEDAERLAAAGGGFVEIGFVMSVVYPWSASLYADRSEPVTEVDAAERLPEEGQMIPEQMIPEPPPDPQLPETKDGGDPGEFVVGRDEEG